jgi:hypothetical protein
MGEWVMNLATGAAHELVTTVPYARHGVRRHSCGSNEWPLQQQGCRQQQVLASKPFGAASSAASLPFLAFFGLGTAPGISASRVSITMYTLPVAAHTYGQQHTSQHSGLQ